MHPIKFSATVTSPYCGVTVFVALSFSWSRSFCGVAAYIVLLHTDFRQHTDFSILLLNLVKSNQTLPKLKLWLNLDSHVEMWFFSGFAHFNSQFIRDHSEGCSPINQTHILIPPFYLGIIMRRWGGLSSTFKSVNHRPGSYLSIHSWNWSLRLVHRVEAVLSQCSAGETELQGTSSLQIGSK